MCISLSLSHCPAGTCVNVCAGMSQRKNRSLPSQTAQHGNQRLESKVFRGEREKGKLQLLFEQQKTEPGKKRDSNLYRFLMDTTYVCACL